MRKKKEENRFDTIEENLSSAIQLAKAEYEIKPSNPLYSIITNLELTLKDIKEIK
jgi:hypothetical protein